ncbi:hypothetical protein AcW1_005379 [Taiwanofungus camphoratus]|nr:hypothetical protein AcW1_005379 [Antrodia cinnamomea]
MFSLHLYLRPSLIAILLSLVQAWGVIGQTQAPISLSFSEANDPLAGPTRLSVTHGPWNGLITFAGTTPLRCFDDTNASFDVAILGAPFDTGTTYRSQLDSMAAPQVILMLAQSSIWTQWYTTGRPAFGGFKNQRPHEHPRQ